MTATEVLEHQKEKSIIDAMVQRAAKEFQEEMDFTILADMFSRSGWTEIEFDPWQKTPEYAYAIKDWLQDHCKGPVHSRGKRFLFQEESDAINFVLRWSN